MVRLTIGYPSLENQMNILNAQRYHDPLSDLRAVTNAQNILEVQEYLSSVRASDEVLSYAVKLCEATRNHPLVEPGVSPRGVSALVKWREPAPCLRSETTLFPEDIQNVFADVCAHRLVLRPQARVDGISDIQLLSEILGRFVPPWEKAADGRRKEAARLFAPRSLPF